MTAQYLYLPIVVPAIGGLIALLLNTQWKRVCEFFTLLVTTAVLIFAALMFSQDLSLIIPWGAFGFEFSFRLYNFSSFIMLGAAVFGYLVSFYSVAFMRERKFKNQFYAYLLFTLAFVNGAVLSDNLFLMLFFWGSLLVTMFGMIAIGGKGAYKTAVKAFVIAGVADFCMLLGIGLTVYLAGTASMSSINLPVTGLGALAFVLLMVGALGKGGAMPFHSWIPDAAIDAPLPFMALIPGAIEKLLGIYFLTRISMDLFQFTPDSWLSTLMMIVGAVTILLAVFMALVQKDFKRLLSFHAISQVGYMVLGIGTGVPAGIVGGLFHMVNNALYKSCLFLTGGAVEKQTGTTDLRKLGGLAYKMPVTFIGFFIAAVSISGVPPFNGFFSKELIYDAALQRGTVFYLAAVLGSFFTAASFLKLGHAAFGGKLDPSNAQVKEAPTSMLFPILTLAGLCVLFGVYNVLPLEYLIQPVLGERLQGQSFAGFHVNYLLVGGTLVVLAAAIINHLWGAKKTGSGLKAVDHIHYAPVAHQLYDQAEKGNFDPYNIGLGTVGVVARIAWIIDRTIDFVYDRVTVGITYTFTAGIRKLHTGSHTMYLAWLFIGLVLVVAYIMGGI